MFFIRTQTMLRNDLLVPWFFIWQKIFILISALFWIAICILHEASIEAFDYAFWYGYFDHFYLDILIILQPSEFYIIFFLFRLRIVSYQTKCNESLQNLIKISFYLNTTNFDNWLIFQGFKIIAIAYLCYTFQRPYQSGQAF